MKKQIMEAKNTEKKSIIEMCQGNNYWNIVSFSRYIWLVVFGFDIVISYSFLILKIILYSISFIILCSFKKPSFITFRAYKT